MKATLNKISSSTKNLHLSKSVEVSPTVKAKAGNVLVVKALAEKKVYGLLELVNGKMVKVRKNDLIAVTLGERKASKGFYGSVPGKARKGDTLHLLNLGGVVGKCVSFTHELGEPIPVKVIGSVLLDGKEANIRQNAVAWKNSLKESAPLVLVAGTSMQTGKSRVCAEIAKWLSRKKLRVAGAKAAGVSCEKDSREMLSAGAVKVLNFTDAGLPSTTNPRNVLPAAKGIFFELNKFKPDAIVVELGDGIIGGYNVKKILRDPEIKRFTKAMVVCANDSVAAWGAKELFKRMGLRVDLFSGPATDNAVGVEFIEKELKIPAANARSNARKIAKVIEKKLA